jgi:hypothetical protein
LSVWETPSASRKRASTAALTFTEHPSPSSEIAHFQP